MEGLDRTPIFDPDTGTLLHEVLRVTLNEAPIGKVTRVDFSEPIAFLQGAIIEIPESHSFRPHVHLDRVRAFASLRAQESWVVIRGEVEVDYFTESGTFISTQVLTAGDITITFRGGHGYRTPSSDALVYEFKSGPYEGIEIDKKFI